MADSITIPSPADFHVHLRQGSISGLIVPHVRKGGFNLAYVMVCGVTDPRATANRERSPI